jgi:pentatricopeptide repeat protein
MMLGHSLVLWGAEVLGLICPQIQLWQVVTAHSKIGDMESVLGLFDKIVKDGLEPSVAVFDSILHACVQWDALSRVVSMPDDQSWTGT